MPDCTELPPDDFNCPGCDKKVPGLETMVAVLRETNAHLRDDDGARREQYLALLCDEREYHRALRAAHDALREKNARLRAGLAAAVREIQNSNAAAKDGNAAYPADERWLEYLNALVWDEAGEEADAGAA